MLILNVAKILKSGLIVDIIMPIINNFKLDWWTFIMFPKELKKNTNFELCHFEKNSNLVPKINFFFQTFQFRSFLPFRHERSKDISKHEK
jgi:hypothetical protein